MSIKGVFKGHTHLSVADLITILEDMPQDAMVYVGRSSECRQLRAEDVGDAQKSMGPDDEDADGEPFAEKYIVLDPWS